MFDLYHGQETAAYRQAELLDEIAAARLARSTHDADQPSTGDRLSLVRKLTLRVSDALAALSGAITVAGRRPRWS